MLDPMPPQSAMRVSPPIKAAWYATRSRKHVDDARSLQSFRRVRLLTTSPGSRVSRRQHRTAHDLIGTR